MGSLAAYPPTKVHLQVKTINQILATSLFKLKISEKVFNKLTLDNSKFAEHDNWHSTRIN
jgi:hypothetical protein